MTPFNLPLTITKGVSFGPVIFNFKNGDGDPFPLTGWSVFAHARPNGNKGGKIKIDLEPAITNAAGGEVQIRFTDEKTAVMTATDYGWDMILGTPTGDRIGPFFAGLFRVLDLYTHNV